MLIFRGVQSIEKNTLQKIQVHPLLALLVCFLSGEMMVLLTTVKPSISKNSYKLESFWKHLFLGSWRTTLFPLWIVFSCIFVIIMFKTLCIICKEEIHNWVYLYQITNVLLIYISCLQDIFLEMQNNTILNFPHNGAYISQTVLRHINDIETIHTKLMEWILLMINMHYVRYQFQLNIYVYK